jgi:hypothetical protein
VIATVLGIGGSGSKKWAARRSSGSLFPGVTPPTNRIRCAAESVLPSLLRSCPLRIMCMISIPARMTRAQRQDSEHPSSDALDRPVILLNDIVEVLTLARFVHRAIKILPLAANLDVCLVHPTTLADGSFAFSERPFQHRHQPEGPVMNRGVIARRAPASSLRDCGGSTDRRRTSARRPA